MNPGNSEEGIMLFVQCSDDRVRKGAKEVVRHYGFEGKKFGLIAVPGGATGFGVFNHIEFFHQQKGVGTCILSVHPDCLWGKGHGWTEDQLLQKMRDVADQVRGLGVHDVRLHIIGNDGTHVDCNCGHQTASQTLHAVNQ